MSEPTEQQVAAVIRALQDAGIEWGGFCIPHQVAREGARAALSAAAPRQAEWQPIETAPKDGTAIILWLPNSTKMVIGYYEKGTKVWWVRHGAMILEKPTRWRPLPELPTGDGEPSDQEKAK